MQTKNLASLCFLCVLFTALVSCGKDISVVQPTDQDITLRGGGNGNGGNGNGKGKKDKDDSGEMDDILYTATYQLSEPDEFDPLYRFSISESGDLILLQTDSTVTSWGTDYWGSWDEPYAFENGIVNYINGLTNVTYDFELLPNGDYDVTKTLIVQSYSSTLPPTTTISHPGVYSLTE